MPRIRLTYANVVASVALFIALGGTSVAATAMINGNKIKRGSIPANRIKKNSLTSTQVNAAKLGTVRSATNATNATNAGHADAATTAGTAAAAANATHATNADQAAHATDADTVGGLAATAFMPAGRVLTGSVSTAAATPQTFLASPLGFRLETDGVAGVDETVTVRNTSSRSLGVVGAASVSLVGPGATRTITAGTSPFGASPAEARFIVQDANAPSSEALVDCFFPIAGAGAVRALCTAMHTS
jgi:hypothetical protein